MGLPLLEVASLLTSFPNLSQLNEVGRFVIPFPAIFPLYKVEVVTVFLINQASVQDHDTDRLCDHENSIAFKFC